MMLDVRSISQGDRPGVPVGKVLPLRRGRLIAIASGKGGVGKTWLAITLAHALARAGRRVLLFDGDLGLANVDIQLGLMPERDLGGLITGRASLVESVTAFAPGGFDILAGRSGSGALAALEPPALARVLAELRAATALYQTVVLDLGAGLDRAVRRMAVAADTLVVVATDEPTSLTDAYAVLKLYAADCLPEKGGGDVRVVVNQAASQAAGEKTFATLARACQAFLGRTPDYAGAVRRDDRVRETIRRQSLLLTRHPASPAAADVERLAAGFAAEPRGLVAGG
ncbi:MinD/ParA family protein [Acidibrevibacterium fodinaquatile]|uniref:MinD/ParA family protein n=1 Tax=Acidibrevibacterium fodinaquatile TaxID=1969806 RepID=UPI001F0866EB|nr:MinD/ParA family protein [Acidibrevibacterium fodinaquatile]